MCPLLPLLFGPSLPWFSPDKRIEKCGPSSNVETYQAVKSLSSEMLAAVLKNSVNCKEHRFVMTV